MEILNTRWINISLLATKPGLVEKPTKYQLIDMRSTHEKVDLFFQKENVMECIDSAAPTSPLPELSQQQPRHQLHTCFSKRSNTEYQTQRSGTYGSRGRCGSFDDGIWLA